MRLSCFIFNKKNIVWGLMLLSSCISMSKDQQTQNLLTYPTLDRTVENSLSTAYFTEGQWPDEKWWETFDSPELNRLITEALSLNPSIQTVAKRVEFAKQSAKVTRSRLFPLVFFDFNESWEYLSHHGLYRTLNPQMPLNANLVDLTLSFNYEFDFWGKNRNLYHAALGKEKAEEAEFAQSQLITATGLAQAFFALKTNLQREQLYKRLFDVRRAIFNLQNLLQEKALFSKLTPLLSEENVLETQKLLFSIRAEVASNRHMINALAGKGPDEPLDIDAKLDPLTHIVIPSTLSLDLLARRPDLMAQIWRVESLAHDVGAAKADFFPDINLRGFGGVESVLYGLLFSPSSKTIGIQPAIHLPIFTAGAIRANVRAKKANFDEAVQQYNNLILKSAQEVADVLVFAQSIFEQKNKQDEIVDAAFARYDLTIQRLESGLDNLFEDYAMQEEVIQKELENATLLYNQYLAVVKLIKAVGGGYQSEYGPPLKAREDEDVN